MTPVALLRRFAAVASLVVLGVFLFNGLVDPYGYLGTPGIPGLTTRHGWGCPGRERCRS